MKELVDWFNRSVEEESHHPLILIGIFIVVFPAIHPLKDGNGRLSRVLTTLLLLRAGYGYVPYSSMEGIIEQNKDSYYLALRRTQQTIRKEEQSWEPWLMFFLKTMAKQQDNRLEGERGTVTTLIPPRSLPPDPGAGENARRDHHQGNRKFNGRQPQHNQTACKKARRAALPYTVREKSRCALQNQMSQTLRD